MPFSHCRRSRHCNWEIIIRKLISQRLIHVGSSHLDVRNTLLTPPRKLNVARHGTQETGYGVYHVPLTYSSAIMCGGIKAPPNII